MTVVDEPAVEPGAPAPDQERPGRRASAGLIAAVALAAVFFVTTVVLAVVAAGLKADKDEVVDSRQDVAEAAGGFVTALLSYDYQDPAGFRERVLAQSAPPFSEQFEEAVDGLESGFEAAQQVSRPTIQDVFVTEVEDGSATAIVVYARTVEGTGGRREESNLYVRVGLVERDGSWRVNDVVNLNLAFATAQAG